MSSRRGSATVWVGLPSRLYNDQGSESGMKNSTTLLLIGADTPDNLIANEAKYRPVCNLGQSGWQEQHYKAEIQRG